MNGLSYCAFVRKPHTTEKYFSQKKIPLLRSSRHKKVILYPWCSNTSISQKLLKSILPFKWCLYNDLKISFLLPLETYEKWFFLKKKKGKKLGPIFFWDDSLYFVPNRKKWVEVRVEIWVNRTKCVLFMN